MLIRKLVVAFLGCFLLLGFSLAHADQPAKKKWTFMVFLNGNNNLDNFGEENIKDMEKVGSNDEINVVVQWASKSSHKVKRLYIQKSADGNTVTSPVIEDLGRVDMGNPETLEDFVAWTVEHYPAEHYFIDVWNHGYGWQSRLAAAVNKDISHDELTGNTISTEQLGHAMARAALVMGHKVDIFGSDACMMGMVEVANEMSDSVQYFVGSQEGEPPYGWPYAQLLKKWQATPNATPTQIVKMLTQEYVKSYQLNDPSSKVTMSAFDLSKLPALNKSLYALGETMRQLPPAGRARVLERFDEVQRFAYRDYADLIDLMTVLSTADQQALNIEEMDNVVAAARAMIIANKTSSGYAHATGISIWLPTDLKTFKDKSKRYKNLRFSINTRWNKTLATLLQGVHQIKSEQQESERTY